MRKLEEVMTGKYTHETVVGVFMIAGLVCIAFISAKLGNVGLLGGDAHSYYAPFSSVSGLRTGNPVEMLGMNVGTVGGFEMDQDKQIAVVTLRIDKDIKIYDDAIASIKTAGLIGDRFVSIDPGGGGDLLAPGDTITDTEAAVDLTELIGKYAFGEVEE
jgi:phospholipid/cholesterol/gamma-HCH transport system substrate-binding protein